MKAALLHLLCRGPALGLVVLSLSEAQGLLLHLVLIAPHVLPQCGDPQGHLVLLHLSLIKYSSNNENHIEAYLKNIIRTESYPNYL